MKRVAAVAYSAGFESLEELLLDRRPQSGGDERLLLLPTLALLLFVSNWHQLRSATSMQITHHTSHITHDSVAHVDNVDDVDERSIERGNPCLPYVFMFSCTRAGKRGRVEQTPLLPINYLFYLSTCDGQNHSPSPVSRPPSPVPSPSPND